MKVAIYCRVSTGVQTTDNQELVLLAEAQRRGWQVVEVFRESESAWKAGHLPERRRMLDQAKRKTFGIIYVWALDRLTREGSAAILNLVDSLKPYNVRIYSYQEPWTEAPGDLSEILFSIAGWVARIESKRRSERVLAGQERVRKFGSKTGKGIGQRGKDEGQRKRTGYLLRYATKKTSGKNGGVVILENLPKEQGK